MDSIIKKQILANTESHPIRDLILKNRFVYIYGPSGVGKTSTIKKLFPNLVEIEPGIFKSKEMTCDFLDRLKGTKEAILIDDIETISDLIGLREITGPVNKGCLIIIGQKTWNLSSKPFIFEFPILSVDEIDKIKPGNRDLAQACKGDVRCFLNSIDFKSDYKDEYRSAKQVIHSLIHVDGKQASKNLVGEYLDEHGNMLGLIQENYIKSKTANLIAVSDSLSIADLLDSYLYAGNWNLLQYFYNEAILIPAYHIGHTVSDISTATIWTKDLNMRMREKKIKTIQNRLVHRTFDHDTLSLIGTYCNTDLKKASELLTEYKLESVDLDTINHLVKIKPKHLNILKKELKSKHSL